ncbi:MAG: DegT/DnrJ/EryC1/StrS family aminotransferase, partial [Myxococcota bacterium]
QAAFLRVKLRALRTWNARRAAWVEQYRSALGEPFELVELQPSAASANHLFVIRTEDRAGLQAHLADTGVGSQIHYPVPCHLQGAFAGLYEPGAFPTTERAAEQILSLPMGPHLGDGNASKVIERVLEWPDLESKGR